MLEPLYSIQLTCVCCEATFHTSRVRQSFKKAIKTDSDFCAYYKEGSNPDYYVVRVCPWCGFASTENSLETLNDRQKKNYLDHIGSKWSPRDYGGARTLEQALESYKIGLLCAQTVGEKNRVVAGLLHHIAWLYRYVSNKEQELRFLRFALEAYIRVYETEDGSVSNARLMFLIGELYRRLDEPYEAVKWFGRVIHDKSIVDAAMIRASRGQWQLLREEMAAKKLALPEEMIDA
ncbi:DUF2225 domain-containing protein [Paenibacillus tarimensis]